MTKSENPKNKKKNKKNLSLESLVTSLDMSRDLWNAGLKLPSFFYWHKFRLKYLIEDDIQVSVMTYNTMILSGKDVKLDIIPAYTFQQLWEILLKIEAINIIAELRGSNINIIDYDQMDSGESICEFRGNSLPNNTAAAILWCVEEEYINLEDINNE